MCLNSGCKNSEGRDGCKEDDGVAFGIGAVQLQCDGVAGYNANIQCAILCSCRHYSIGWVILDS